MKILFLINNKVIIFIFYLFFFLKKKKLSKNKIENNAVRTIASKFL